MAVSESPPPSLGGARALLAGLCLFPQKHVETQHRPARHCEAESQQGCYCGQNFHKVAHWQAAHRPPIALTAAAWAAESRAS